jgi:hypothetical protein
MPRLCSVRWNITPDWSFFGDILFNMTSLAGHSFVIEVAAVVVALIALAIALAKWIRFRRAALWPAQSDYHDVTVGPAKAYDNRSLALMLDQLLRRMNSAFSPHGLGDAASWPQPTTISPSLR